MEGFLSQTDKSCRKCPTLHKVLTIYSNLSFLQGVSDTHRCSSGWCSHIADVVRHCVLRFPSFDQYSTEWSEPPQCSVPCVGVSVPWVFPEVKGQSVWGAMCPQSRGELQQLRRLNEVGAVQDKRQHHGNGDIMFNRKTLLYTEYQWWTLHK